ncbi:MAG: hypothetical protein ABJX32_04210 [Tateyamaria sp.]|uniref:hypothetical protein n=1 Tax=Tateyamaria sp. TaxID=1929288 RepID=UPI00329FE4BC
MRSVAHIGRYAVNHRVGALVRPVLARPFRGNSRQRVAVLYEPNRIAYAQVYPFVFHAREFEARHDIQLRFFSVEDLEAVDFSGIDTILFQLWFTREPSVFELIFDRAVAGGARLVAFLDSFAHNDLRFAELINGHVDYYLKKSLFRDLDAYARPTLGHTNLTDHYQRAFGIADETYNWPIPEGFTNKLRLSPNFFTAPRLHDLFVNQDLDAVLARQRDIDLHARMGRKGSAWYTAMRDQALAQAQALKGVRVVADGMVDLKTFHSEMARSRMCFSPFGYGEVCWRDVESMAHGAVLLKPSMDHLRTLPDLYEADVTYVPLAWDCSDLAEKVDWVTAHPDAAQAMVSEAFTRVRNYIMDRRFLTDMAFLFS